MNFAPRLLLTAFVLLSARAFSAESDPITPDEVRQGYRSSVLLAKPRSAATNTAPAESAEQVRVLRVLSSMGGLRTLETNGREDVRAVARRLAATGLYEYVEPDYLRFAHVVPDDTRFGSDQWSLNNTGTNGGTAGADIKAVEAWNLQREAPDVIVAVLDTGLRFTHTDIATNVWTNTAEKNGAAGVDDDMDFIVDDVHGINAIAMSSDPLKAGDPTDNDGHGSHVAGIIGAVANNHSGIAGVAWKVQIMPLKFMDATQGGTVSMVVRCIDYAVKHGAKVINASYGGSSYSQAEFDAIRTARDSGVIVVASAGNDSTEINDNPVYPAAYLLDNVVSVASTTRQDKLASYSTYGSGLVELAAPGSSILSLGIENDQDYAVMSGTSMAAPHVSGAVALLRQKFPNDTYRAIINRLLSSVDLVPALEHRVQTNGRLNLLRALSTTDARPFNDDFAQRATVIGFTNKMRASNQYATLETGESAHGTAGSGSSIWWKWTAPVGVAKVSLNTFGSSIDTVLAVYQGDSLGTLKLIGSNDDFNQLTGSSVAVDVVPGETYSIAVAGKASAQGTVILSLSTTPANDVFAKAQEVTGPSVNVAGNNAGATAETGEPRTLSASSTGIARYSVWYKWTAPSTRRFQASVSDEAIDPIVGVYTGNAVTGLTLVDSNDDSSEPLYRYDSLVGFNATKDTVYYIKVDSATGEGGLFHLTISDAAWQALAMTANYVTPAVGPDGTLYMIDFWGVLYAVNPDGTRKWVFLDAKYTVTGGGPAIAADGTICFGDDSGTVYAVGADGRLRWSATTGAPIWATPAIAADGTCYVKSDDGKLYAFGADGTKKWTSDAPGETYSPPVVAPDGTIYIAASSEKALYAINPDGSRKWARPFDMGAETYASPALGTDGTVYVGNYDGRFFAIKPDGTERWHFDTSAPMSSSAVIDNRGYVYFASYDTKLYALDAAGAKKWEYATGDVIRGTAPVIGDDGTIFIGSDDGFVHALTSDGALRRKYAVGSSVYGAPALLAGHLYVPTYDAKLHAFDVGIDAARSPWPMHRNNVRRLGRAVDLAGMPTITTQPASATVKPGQPVTFSAAATVANGRGVTYQWQLNNAPIAGATNATYTIPAAGAANAGTYSVVVTGTSGWTPSSPATLTVDTGGGGNPTRVINFSLRGFAGLSERTLIVGFAVDGSRTKKIFLRGIGAKLADFGVSGTLPDPKLQVFNDKSVELTSNDNWTGDDGHSAGGFELSVGSKDSVVSQNFGSGTFTAQLTGAGGGTGEAMVEIYDGLQSDTTVRLSNVSARTQLDANQRLIVGFTTLGGAAKKIVVRAVGPTLKAFGLDTAHGDPRIELYDSAGKKIGENDNWSGYDGREMGFALVEGSKDAVISQTLEPGGYYVHVLSAAGTSGVVLVEVYLAP